MIERLTIATAFSLALCLLLISSANDCYGQQGSADQALVKFQKQLSKRVARDQAARIALIDFNKKSQAKPGVPIDQKKYDRLAKKASDTDDQNLAWIKKHVTEYGVPAVSEIGWRSADHFFLLVLHADRDREFQKDCIVRIQNMPSEWPESYWKLLQRRASASSSKITSAHTIQTPTKQTLQTPTEPVTGPTVELQLEITDTPKISPRTVPTLVE